MSIQTSTLRPGLLVGLKSSVAGGVRYDRTETNVTVEGQQETAELNTIRTIHDRKEYEAAHKARSKARAIISAVCVQSAFGLLCTKEREDELDEAVKEAEKVADEFNKTAKICRLSVSVLTGEIAQDDVKAVQKINKEVRELLDDMSSGIKNLDVEAVRDAANRAKSLGSMLKPDAQARIQMAVEAARQTARKMVKAGEQAAAEIDKNTLRTITESRTAFLDLDGEREVGSVKADARALDLAPEAPAPKAKKAKASRQIEV